MKTLNMKNLGNAKFGVELDSTGNELDDSQGLLLKVLNSLALAGVLSLLAIVAGTLFKQFFIDSPLLMIFGYVVSVILLLIAQLATAIWWLITGAREPMAFINNALPFGSEGMRTAVCLLPLAIFIFTILCKSYSKIYVSKINAVIVLLALLACLTLLCLWLQALV